MHYDDDHGPDPASAETYRAGTDAVVVGNVDDVQVRATSEGAELPSDMRLAIVDPGATVTSTRREQPDIDTATLESATLSSAGTGTLPAPTDPAAAATPVDPAAPPVTDPAITPAATRPPPSPRSSPAPSGAPTSGCATRARCATARSPPASSTTP